MIWKVIILNFAFPELKSMVGLTWVTLPHNILQATFLTPAEICRTQFWEQTLVCYGRVASRGNYGHD